MSQTIKQAAEQLGISKTAVRKYFTDEFKTEYVSTDPDGRLLISDEGIIFIKEKLTYRAQTKANPNETITNRENKLSETPENIGENQGETTTNQSENQAKNTENTGFSNMLSFLQKQLEEKDKQLAEKDRQLAAKDEQITNLTAAVENATKSTQAAQALAAVDKQLLLEASTKKSWWPWNRKAKKTNNQNYDDNQE